MYEKRKKAAKAMLKKSKKKDTFKPHLMYDKKGKAFKADTIEDHNRMSKMGYTHKKDMK
tara:strand:+ start:1451 stop:1627 length:177 start_codon:yes stop_codon:yes gene_type:complete